MGIVETLPIVPKLCWNRPMQPETTHPAEPGELVAVLGEFHTESGRSLLEIVDESAVLLIFLRHFGCAFCRQALDQVSRIREQIESKGTTPIFVNLGSPERARPYFDYYRLSDVERVSNPDASLYRHPAFALSRRNPFLHLLSPAVWRAWFAGALPKYGLGTFKEDAHQMPGVFFLKGRRIVRGFRYQTIADEPNYLKLIGAG